MPNCVGEHILFKIDPIYFQGCEDLDEIKEDILAQLENRTVI